MDEAVRESMEIIFNLAYLAVVWTLVVLMLLRRKNVIAADKPLAKRFILAFALLAAGDTGHVGFRVVAYFTGGLDAHPELVGIGALSTAYTVTLFYMIMLDIWKVRYQKAVSPIVWFLWATGIARMIFMLFPQNQWSLVVPPFAWSVGRNAFLTVQGIGVLILILRDAAQTHDRPFTWIGIMIALSFAFYAPVILFVSQVPLVGMLMIPKTCAYLGVAVIAYRALFTGQHTLVTQQAA